MRRLPATVVLPTIGTVLALSTLAAVGHANGFSDPGPPPRGEDLSGAPRVIGASKATCTVRKCRYKMTCDYAGGAPPAGFLAEACLFTPTLYGNGGPLTGKGTCIVDPESPQDVEEQCAFHTGKGVVLNPGRTKTLKLKVIKPGRQQIKYYLGKGKRVLKRGSWEAQRIDVVIVEEYDAYGEPTGAAAEQAQTFENAGFLPIPVQGGYLIYEFGDLKVRLKG